MDLQLGVLVGGEEGEEGVSRSAADLNNSLGSSLRVARESVEARKAQKSAPREGTCAENSESETHIGLDGISEIRELCTKPCSIVEEAVFDVRVERVPEGGRIGVILLLELWRHGHTHLLLHSSSSELLLLFVPFDFVPVSVRSKVSERRDDSALVLSSRTMRYESRDLFLPPANVHHYVTEPQQSAPQRPRAHRPRVEEQFVEGGREQWKQQQFR